MFYSLFFLLPGVQALLVNVSILGKVSSIRQEEPSEIDGSVSQHSIVLRSMWMSGTG